jgi:hypothetical protein
VTNLIKIFKLYNLFRQQAQRPLRKASGWFTAGQRNDPSLDFSCYFCFYRRRFALFM